MKSLKNLLSPLLLITLFILLANLNANAQTVRGQLLRKTPSGQYFPASYIAVNLLSQQRGKSAIAYSSPDGIFILYNVPPGQYILQISSPNNKKSFPVSVDKNKPITVLPPINL